MSIAAPAVEAELARVSVLRAQLLAEVPDLDEDTLRDTVEGLSDLPALLASVVRSQLEDEAWANALRGRLDDMHERLTRIELRIEKKRAFVTRAMAQADLRKLVEPEFTASLRQTSPSLAIEDELGIPADYWKPQPAKLDRAGLLAALKAGETVPGAALKPPGLTLSVRTR